MISNTDYGGCTAAAKEDLRWFLAQSRPRRVRTIRQFGPGATELLYEALDDAEQEVGRSLGDGEADEKPAKEDDAAAAHE